VKGFWNRLVDVRWGEKGFVALCVSVVSGVVVALQYQVQEPLYSTAAMDILVPFGGFFRALHFYSSQLFFLFFLVHFAVIVLRNGAGMECRRWLMLIASLPVAVLWLFTGYVLRGDATGHAAGVIAENIALSIPVAGGLVNGLLFAVNEYGLSRVYANHLAGLSLLWLALSWDHLRRYRVGFAGQGGMVAALLIFSALVPAPMELELPGTGHIAGPWFFLGLQELLRYAQPFWAGLVFPAVLIVSLAGLCTPGASRHRLKMVVLGWIAVYAALSVVSAFR